MDQVRLGRVLALVILFLLATTLFNTLRANRVERRTTSFRKQARYELKLTKQQLNDQKEINARLEQKLNLLLAEQAEGSAGD
jgi:F0F1-type ATP synthase alpha subunit